LLTGVTLVVLCLLHGASFMCLKTTGQMHERAWHVMRRVAPIACVVVIAFIIWTHVAHTGAFLLNPIELLAVLAVIAAVWLVYEDQEGFAFAASTVTIGSCIVAIFVGLYPNVMVSATSAANNLTIHNSASPAYPLKVMTIVAILLVPVVLGYQTWTYYVFRRRVSAEEFRPRPSTPPTGTAARSVSDGAPPPARGPV
jgi:cytochrome d ubiquinol oxidase subunit II